MIKSISFILSISLCQAVLAEEKVNSSFFGYKTVTEALADLKIKKNASVSENEGWIIIKLVDGNINSTWSFAPASHPAYPAVFRDDVVKIKDSITFNHQTLCQAEKIECDKFVSQSRELNKRFIETVLSGV
jgi:hypothetical protein